VADGRLARCIHPLPDPAEAAPANAAIAGPSGASRKGAIGGRDG
jgi:hypothetical protein